MYCRYYLDTFSNLTRPITNTVELIYSKYNYILIMPSTRSIQALLSKVELLIVIPYLCIPIKNMLLVYYILYKYINFRFYFNIDYNFYIRFTGVIFVIIFVGQSNKPAILI